MKICASPENNQNIQDFRPDLDMQEQSFSHHSELLRHEPMNNAFSITKTHAIEVPTSEGEIQFTTTHLHQKEKRKKIETKSYRSIKITFHLTTFFPP